MDACFFSDIRLKISREEVLWISVFRIDEFLFGCRQGTIFVGIVLWVVLINWYGFCS